MKKVMIPGVREIYYIKRMKDCGVDKCKEVYSKTMVAADMHNEAIAFFKEHVADENVVKILTSGAVYVCIDDKEDERLEWM